ncbi:alpha/beta fold hydrolase [Pseudolysinimonas sp.]|uniref:alpha/beta fold hydrolase n=1 Tax=Pseudolysinimonas sp. TaxID=2680009 RepID=UPI0037852E46
METPAPALSDVLHRNNVTVSGVSGARPIVFAHGFGCSQVMWRHVAPAFESDHLVVLFDSVGSGESDLSAYRPGKYDSLEGYAADLLEILEALDLRNAVIVGHSVSAMVAVLAANRDSSRIGRLVLLGPSPRYIDTPDYRGGFSREDIHGLLDALDANYFGWSKTMAPVIMGNPDRAELGEELTESFCATDPAIARHFAHVTFLSDTRRDLAGVSVPTLVIQTENDVIAPLEVGRFVHESIPRSVFRIIPVSGHMPHLSGPAEVIAAIREFVG